MSVARKFRGSRIQYGFGLGNILASGNREVVPLYQPVVSTVSKKKRQLTRCTVDMSLKPAAKKVKRQIGRGGSGKKNKMRVSRDVVLRSLRAMNKKSQARRKRRSRTKPRQRGTSNF